MFPFNCRKHKRSYSINRFEDLELNTTDQNTLFKNEEISTKATPIRITPNQISSQSEINKLIQSIQQKISLESMTRSQKSKVFRDRLLQELKRSASTTSTSLNMVQRKPLKSIDRTKKKKEGQTSRTKSRPKQKKSLVSVKEARVQRSSSKTYRNKSSDFQSCLINLVK